MFRMTFLNEIFSLICFCPQDFTKVVRLLFTAVSINGLKIIVGLSKFLVLRGFVKTPIY